MKISGLAAAAAMLFAAGVQAGGHVSLTAGTRVLDDSYGELDRQLMIGLLGDIQIGRSPVHFEWGLRGSAKEETRGLDTSVALFDLSLGAMLKPVSGDIRPYFSAGVASVGIGQEQQRQVGITVVTRDESDQSFGYYAATGVMVRLNRSFELGFDARYLGGTEFQFGTAPKFDADSYTVALRAGWNWGGAGGMAPAARTTDTGTQSALPPASTPTTATLPEASSAKIIGLVARCNEFLAANGFGGACTLADAPAGYPQLGIPLPTPAESNRHNATVSSQLVDPFCSALREAGRTGTVRVSASSINYATRYDCGLRSWSAWAPR